MLSEAIRRYRLAANLTQSELAKQIGVAQNSVANWENGARTPPIKRLIALAKVLGVTPNDLTGAGQAPASGEGEGV